MSLFSIAVVSAMITGGAIAYFSDTEISTGNSFTAGIIDIELSNLNAEGAFINIPDIKPCQTMYGFFDIHGMPGTNPGPVYIHITGVATGDGVSVSDEDAAVNDIDTMMTVSLISVTEAPWNIPDNEMAEWLIDNTKEVIIDHDDHMKLSDLNSAIIPVGWISGYSSRIWLVMDLHLQAETGNEYQGDTCSFNVEVMMTQDGAPPPVQSGNKIILENKDDQWNPILGDGIWGIVEYNTSTLTLDIHVQGLKANFDYQVGINSPEDVSYYPVSGGEPMRVAMASALASNHYNVAPGPAPASGYNLFERGYDATPLSPNYVTGKGGVFTTSKNGVTARTITTDGSGSFDAGPSFPLPSGAYEWIKVLVKEDSGPLWSTILMEKSFGLFFTIP